MTTGEFLLENSELPTGALALEHFTSIKKSLLIPFYSIDAIVKSPNITIEIKRDTLDANISPPAMETNINTPSINGIILEDDIGASI